MTPITALPPAPTRASGADDFSDKADTYVTALPGMVDELNAFGVEVEDIADRAEAAALTAVNAPGTSATSVTSLTVGTGDKALAIQPDKALAAGQWVTIARTSAPAVYMLGFITAHDPGTGALSVAAQLAAGVGTFTDWTIALSAPLATNGATAAQVRAGTEQYAPVTPKALFEASAPVVVADGPTITLDMGAGFNFLLTLGGNRTLGDPANAKPGTSGVLAIVMGSAGGWQLSLPQGSKWRFPSGFQAPSGTPGSISAISFIVYPDFILGGVQKGFI